MRIRNSTCKGGYGVATAIVCFADDTNTPLLLSASHVLAATASAAVGDQIIVVDASGTPVPGPPIATLSDWTGLIDGPGYPNLADAAIAKLNIDPNEIDTAVANLRFAVARPFAGSIVSSNTLSKAGGAVAVSSDNQIITWNDSTPAATLWDYGMADHIIGAFGVVDGDSGGAVLDSDGALIGLISGVPTISSDAQPRTAISWIGNIANHDAWKPRRLIAWADRATPPAIPDRTPSDPDDFIAMHRDTALGIKGTYKIPASVCLAQAALESGWGQKVVGCAYFGVKGGSSGTGSVVTFMTHEANAAGELISTPGTFRSYANFAEAAKDWAILLTTSDYYRSAFDFTDQPVQFARRIAVHYATDPNYADALVDTLHSRNLLSLDT